MVSRTQRIQRGSILVAAVLVMVVQSTALADDSRVAKPIPEGLIVFPNLTAKTSFDGNHDTDLTPALDVFCSHDFDRLRLLGEVFLNRREQELERIQIGWLLSSNNTGWAGRLHTPLGHWNTRYHHGTYLQTTISRPGVLEFEDRGGVLPLHLAGAMLQGRRSVGSADLTYEMAIGAGPEMTDGGLEPFDVLKPSQHDHGFSYAVNLALKPLDARASQVGTFFGRFELPSKIAALRDADLLVAGTWGLWQHQSLQILAAGFYVHDQVREAGARHSASFVSGYLQAQWQLDTTWSLYGRIEESGGASGDPYLALFPHFTQQVYLGGVRLNLSSRHSLRIEFADRNRLANDFKEVVFQWTAGLP